MDRNTGHHESKGELLMGPYAQEKCTEGFRNCVAFGRGAQALGNGAVAVGIGAEAHGDGSMAIGHGLIARDGERKIAIDLCVGGGGAADIWYEFFQSLRDSVAGSWKPEENENG